PLFTSMSGGVHAELTQVLLRDVTDQHGFQNYAQEIIRAQEDERQRMAQELHDVSVQSAILICRQLDAASDAVETRDPAVVTRTIAEARHAAESMADELRRFSRDLRPLILEDLGLVPALKRLVTELRGRSQTHLRFEVKGLARRLAPGTELVLFRIGQEALRNAEHHASATHVSVRLSFEGDTVRLGVVDNGSGFVVPPLTTLVNAGRLGVLGMQERALLLGGRCEVQSNPGHGTHVTAEIPIGTPSAARGAI
ncbi:MAG: sensor histidine kinase, partial [Anaerolineaceae bacterium]